MNILKTVSQRPFNWRKIKEQYNYQSSKTMHAAHTFALFVYVEA